MARDATVTFEDGTTAIYKGIPDEIAPEAVIERAQKEFNGKRVTQLDGGRDTSGGLAERVMNTLTAGYGKAANSVPQLLMAPANAFGGTPLSRHLSKITDTVNSFYSKIGAQGVQNDWGRSGLEAVAGGAAFGAVTPVGVVSSLAGGLGGEAGGKLTNDSVAGRITGSVLGSLAGGVGAAKLAAVRPQSGAVAKEAMEGVSEQQLLAAQKYQAELAAKNIQIDLAQALEAQGVPANNLTRIRDILANKPQGSQLQQVLRDQPGQLSIEADQVAARLPGTVRAPTEVANNLAQASTDTIRDLYKQRQGLWEKTLQDSIAAIRSARQPAVDMATKQLDVDLKELAKAQNTLRSQAYMMDQAFRSGKAIDAGKLQQLDADIQALGGRAQALYAAQQQAGQSANAMAAAKAWQSEATRVPVEVARQQVMHIRALAAERPNTPVAGMLEELANNLMRDRDMPLVRADQINEVLKASASKAKPNLATAGVDAGALKYVQKVVNETRDNLATAFTPYRKANEQYKAFTENVVNPVKQGPVGQFAGKTGAAEDVQAALGKFDSLMEKGSDINSKTSDIRTLGTKLAKANPEAFADALKSYVSKKIGKSMQAGVGGNVESATAANNPNMAAKIWDGLGWDDKLKAQGLRDAVAVSAKSMGEKPEEVVRGLNNFMQIIKAMKSRPGAVGGMGQQDLEQLAGNSKLASGIRMFGMIPFSDTARKVQEQVLNKTLSEFGTILTSPEGAQMLIKLGKMPVMSRAAQTILATYGSAASQTPDNIPE